MRCAAGPAPPLRARGGQQGGGLGPRPPPAAASPAGRTRGRTWWPSSLSWPCSRTCSLPPPPLPERRRPASEAAGEGGKAGQEGRASAPGGGGAVERPPRAGNGPRPPAPGAEAPASGWGRPLADTAPLRGSRRGWGPRSLSQARSPSSETAPQSRAPFVRS